MSRTPILLTVVALTLTVVAAGAGAQNHSEDFLLSGTSLQLLHGTGTFSTLYDNSGTAHGASMDLDNRGVVYAVTDLHRVDPTSGRASTLFPIGLGGFSHVTIDHNGDYIVSGIRLGASNYGIFRIRNNTLTTIVNMTRNSGTFALLGGLIRDIDTGRFVLQVHSGATGPHPLISVAPDGTFTSLVRNISTLGIPRYELTQDIRTGDFFVGVNGTTGGYLVRASRNGATSVVATSQDRWAFNALVADRASAAAPRIVHAYLQNLYYTDLTTFAITSVAVNGNSVSTRDIDIWQGRNIQPVRTAPGLYSLHFSFPNHPGRNYVVGMSLSGVRPGFSLPDGRHLALNPDALTLATVNNLLPAVFHPGPAVLDTTGAAQGRLDLSAAPLPLGVTAHLAVVVLDPAAPAGIAVVSDPYVLPL